MKKTPSVEKRLSELHDHFKSKKPVVVQAIFGDDGEFGSVKFERRGGDTRVLEFDEPEPVADENAC